VIGGAAIFGVAYSANPSVMAVVDAVGQSSQSTSDRLASGKQTFNPLIYSLDAFLPIIDLHQETRWLPVPGVPCSPGGGGLPCGTILRWYLWAHILAGWMLTTLAVTGFTGLIRTS
jgi:hypothetical protein